MRKANRCRASITLDPSNVTFYTNRAFARLKLQAWDAVISDCLQSIDLNPANMKAYYYLAQAQMGLHHPNEALASALTAYELSLQMNNASAGSISALILKAKKEKWEMRERERLRRRSELLRELEDRLERARLEERRAITAALERGAIGRMEAQEELQSVDELSREKVDELRKVFAMADPQNLKRRVSPCVSSRPEFKTAKLIFSCRTCRTTS